MPKSLFADPEVLLRPGEIRFQNIPVNRYAKTVAEERGNFSDAELWGIYCDMAAIREFETMLHEVKTLGEYAGQKMSYAGPAHLSMGQEAGAVGQAFCLDAGDFIFGSHRSHGEFIAKAYACIRRMEETELLRIMEECSGGETYRAVRAAGLASGDVRETARAFVLYGLLSELLAKRTGFNRGLGGSMHAFFLPFGIYPNNAIVGGSADIAAGAALFKKLNREGGIVVANIGDGASTCGNVWEALHFSAMGQYDALWEETYRGGLPILFNFNDNQYSMGDQPNGETTGMGGLARIGAAINPAQMHAEQVNGYHPLAVIEATRRMKKLLLFRQGPALLSVSTYRFGGHSPSDPSSYRTREEIEAWKVRDPIETYGKELVAAGLCDEKALAEVHENIRKLLAAVCAAAADGSLSPRLDLDRDPLAIERYMFSNQVKPIMREGPCDVLTVKEDNPRVQSIAQKERFGIREGQAVPKGKTLQIRDAIFEALLDAFYTDPTLVAYGEGVRDWGGAFAVYRGLMDSLPYHRLFNAPIAEGAIVGTAVGYGMAGGRAVVELMYCDFFGRAGDQVMNQLAKWQAMSAGILQMPVVVRVSVGSKYGAQHSQDWTSVVSHIPGLKVVYPVTPYDAKGLMHAALQGTDPVIFFESQALYDMGELFHAGGVPKKAYALRIGEPDVKRPGKDLTILTVGPALYRALAAAETLERAYGVSAEVIDARSLVPFEYEKVIASVKKTGRVLVVGDACERGSMLSDFARNITERAFDWLDAPPVVLGAKNWITPAHEFEQYFFPQPEGIIRAVHEKILPLQGYR